MTTYNNTTDTLNGLRPFSHDAITEELRATIAELTFQRDTLLNAIHDIKRWLDDIYESDDLTDIHYEMEQLDTLLTDIIGTFSDYV